MASELPTVRWGIVATGLISSWFASDIIRDRPNKQASHIIQAVGSSSLEKGKAFVEKHIPGTTPSVYGSYEEVYADPNVDVVSIGTPHAFHKQNCLDAIKHGKNVLCEKAFTLNAAEAKEVFAAAKEKGVFIMEAMWTRFYPLIKELQRLIHAEKVVGDVHRVFCDFALAQNIASLPADSRLKNPALGAGTLLDIGIYSLTYGLITLDGGVGDAAENPKIAAQQHLVDGVDVATSIILLYPGAKQGILTCSSFLRGGREFCRIEGTKGTIVVEGIAASAPSSFTVNIEGQDPKKYEFEKPGFGFYFEADAVAADIAAGRKENATMPWAETVRVLEMLDEVRRQGGAIFPQEKN
ncbi:hypothetical protein jhhlp_001679 [Lomentospora prolificans]|uniref:D-xylose 1-dehydrogenase (NADP(+), D-xylono-1,5-lactone-forming) n=1 Tax=Lomentospora prolificans TaxID=41688 RepID=A0A2N3NH20_9PEZI|nr:hypothetical protein jhhlp_001679 [Lomentospora prolificans]